MAIALTPRWQSRRFSVAPGAPLFDTVLVEERGLLVAGGPDALAVFAIGDRQFEWFTIPKKSWITGFAVSASSLYVQDGPVMLNYDLTLGKAFSAINLLTGARWSIEDSPVPPDDLYVLTGGQAALQRDFHALRYAYAAALESPLDGGRHFGRLEAEFLAAQHAARGIDFSPPVIRKRQMEGRRTGSVFSLRMDGRVTALDTALEEAVSLASDEPLRPELVVAEVQRPGGDVDCFLYYITAGGGINAINATGNLAVLPGWRPTGAPVAARVLPLRYQEGMLLGGGILGAAFFARTLDTAKPPLVQLDGPAEGWRQYEISPHEKLLLLSDGLQSRLVSYDPVAKNRIRWKPDRVSGSDAHVMFWTGTGAGALETSPKLVLEIEKLAPANAHQTGVRVLLANTVDPADPALITGLPPAPFLVDQGKFESGSTPAWLPVIDAMPCRPVVAHQSVYAVVGARAASGAWTYSVAAFSLAPHLPALTAKADAELSRLKLLARVLEVNVTRFDEWYEAVSWETYERRTRGPYAAANTRLAFELTPGGRVEAETDAQGVARFDSVRAGSKITVTGLKGLQGCTSATLTPAGVANVHMTVRTDI